MSIPHRHRAAAVALLLPLALAACSGTPTASGQPDTHVTAAATTPASKPMDATAVLAKLTAAKLPISNGAVQDENTDPNNLLGRPNGYTSRASFDVTGGDRQGNKATVDRGGVIEVFADATAAKTRADYIAALQKASPILGTEYHYLHGPVLVRVSGKVKPSVAAGFQAAVAGLPV
jgi:hypothetical protein